jgi:hypothetical protein
MSEIATAGAARNGKKLRFAALGTVDGLIVLALLYTVLLEIAPVSRTIVKGVTR